MKPVIITFASWKGGTGKTTLMAAVVYVLAKLGFKCGIIDIDSNLSMSVIFNATHNNFTSFNLLSGIQGVFQKVMKNIHIIPSRLEISKLDNMSQNELAYRLKKMDLSDFDFIFIDPPGTMNALTRNAICAADKIIVPATPSSIDYAATSLVFDELEMMNIESDVTVIVNDSMPKTNTPGILEKFAEEYKEFIYPEIITNMLSLKNLTTNIYTYNFSGIAKGKIDRFVKEVIL